MNSFVMYGTAILSIAISGYMLVKRWILNYPVLYWGYPYVYRHFS